MLELYRTKNKDVHRKVEILLERKLGTHFNIARTQNGKPYIQGNPLYFSVSHSRSCAIIALSDKPIGVDVEFTGKDARQKSYQHVLSRFTEREKQWIGNSSKLFFFNWVAKESYIKMLGETLAHLLKRLEYFDYGLYCDGKKTDYGIFVTEDLKAGIFSVCAEGYTDEEICKCPVKLFRLKKTEHI